MFRIIKKSLKTPVVTGQYPKAEAAPGLISPEAAHKTKPFRRSLTIREVDTGSCNACEMEMNALRSQMNPHFIFNCINSIDGLIQSNDKYQATLYLNKFA